MVELDVGLKASAAIVSLVFAALVVSGGPRRNVNRFLGFFLLLIAGNQAAEAIRSSLPNSVDPPTWFRVATVFAALDPFILYYFASIYPERNALNRRSLLVAAALPAAALALLSSLLYPHWWPLLHSQVTLVAWAVYTAGLYTVVLVHYARGVLRGSPGSGLLYVAMCLVTLPAWPRALDMIRSLLLNVQGLDIVAALLARSSLYGLVWFVPAVLSVLVVYGIVARRPAVPLSSRRMLLWGMVAGASFSVGLYSFKLIEAARAVGVADFDLGAAWFDRYDTIINEGGTAIRWIVFGLLGSTALLRGRLLDVPLVARRRAARAVLLLAFVLGAVLLLAVVPPVDAGLVGPGELLVLGVALALSPFVHRLVDRVAFALYRVPVPGDRAAALDAYVAAVREVHRLPKPGLYAADLARLRDELGIDPRTAQVLERIAEENAAVTLEPGARLQGRYRLDRLLSRGERGRVLEAWDELLERRVVVKEVVGPGDLDDPVLHEARLAGGLSHPNVVTVHDVLRVAGHVLLITEHVPGGSLGAHVDQGPVPLWKAGRIIDDVLLGLEAVHACGIVHRDLTPANVLLTEDGRAKIADFGTARLRTALTLGAGDGPLVGTLAFMAPEQREGRLATSATDLFAAGLLWRSMAERAPPLVEDVIGRALAERPQDRWPDARSMRLALQEALSAGVGREEDTSPRRSRRRLGANGGRRAEVA